MPEPLIANVLLEAVKAAIRGAIQYSRSRNAAATATEREINDAYAHALGLLGAILVECRANVERVRLIHREQKAYFSPFYFDISDALVPEFCRIAPNPAVLSKLRSTIAALKRVDFFLRVAAHGDPEQASARKAVAFANDAIKKDLIVRYNELVDVATSLNRSLGNPDGLGLPLPIDPNADIDHSAL